MFCIYPLKEEKNLWMKLEAAFYQTPRGRTRSVEFLQQSCFDSQYDVFLFL